MNVYSKVISVLTVICILCMVNGCKNKTEQNNSDMMNETEDTTEIIVATDDTVVAGETVNEEKAEEATDTIAKKSKKAAEPKKTAPARKPLTLIIKNLQSASAPVTIGVYGTKNKFPDPEDQLKEYKFRPKGKQLIAKIKDMPYGIYALAIYQDENNNGKIDKNFLGIPTEHYAFSNNYKPTIKAPAFKDCNFTYNEKTNSVTMTMIK